MIEQRNNQSEFSFELEGLSTKFAEIKERSNEDAQTTHPKKLIKN